MADKKTFKTYNQAKENELFAHSLVKVVDESTGKVTLQLKNNEATPAALGDAIAVGRGDGIGISATAATASDAAKVTVSLKDTAGTAFATADLEKVVMEDFSQTLTNKTIDADDNTISDLELDNFKSGVVQTSVRAAASATDTSVSTEKGVRTELDKKIDAVTVAGVAQTSTLTDGVRTVNVPVATSAAGETAAVAGVIKPDDKTVQVDAGVLSAKEYITYAMEAFEPESAQTSILKVYKLKKTDTTKAEGSQVSYVGDPINIPKDFLVKSARVVTAVAYAVNTAYAAGDVVTYTEESVTKGYIVKKAITAAENTQFSDLTTEVMSETVAVGTKVIVFIINTKDSTKTAEDEFLHVMVGDLLTVYTAGNGLTLDANHRFSANLTTNGGLKFSGSTENEKTLGVDYDDSTLNINATSGKLQIKDAGVDTTQIKDSAVTTAKIADSNVTTDKIADANVTTAKIADGNVTTDKIADANVTTAKIADSNVTTAKLDADAVTNAKLADNAVQSENIKAGEVKTANLADENVTTDKLAASAVTEAKIADEAVTEAKIAKAFRRKLYEVSESDGVLTFTQVEADA